MRRRMKFSLCFGYVFASNWDRRYLFLCWYFEIISDFWFNRVYCDGWVIITTFSWRLSRHLLDILLEVEADFITSQVMLGVMFLFFSFQMYADIVRVFQHMFFVWRFPLLHLCSVSLNCLSLLWSCIPWYFRQFPCRMHVDLSLQLHWLLVSVVLLLFSFSFFFCCCDLL